MKIAGIDYSINCPSVCVFDTEEQFDFLNCSFYIAQNGLSQKESKRRQTLTFDNIFLTEQFGIKDNEQQRYFLLADWVLSIIKENNVCLVAMEAYSMASKGKVFNIAEATGLLKHYLFLSNIKLSLFPPTVIKKNWSGKGNAGKDLMCEEFTKRTNIKINEILGIESLTNSPCSDIVDSMAVCHTLLTSMEDN